MKTTVLTRGVFLFGFLPLLAAASLAASDGPLTVVSRAAHEREWKQTNELGEIVTLYTEIGTGLCYWDEASQTWRDSNPEIEIRAGIEGTTAEKGAHKLKLASNANNAGATIAVTMPDGSQIQLKTIGLALTALDNSNSVFISEVQDSIGEKIDANTVIYRNAFSPVKADLRVRNSFGGVESDVILRERVDPTQWGFEANNCRLEVWTKVLQAPPSTVRTEQIPGRRPGDADEDQQIDFPAMSFMHGTAFRIKSQQGEAAQAVSNIRVAKEMIRIPDENATFLIEAIPFQEAEEAIETLPINEARAKPDTTAIKRMMAASSRQGRVKPISFESRFEKNDRQVAMIEKRDYSEQSGYVIDFNLGSTVTSYTFRGDTTYYASANFAMNGTTTFEGGTILKLAASVTATVNGPVKFLSSSYRPAIITAVNDHTVGDKIGTAAQAQPNEYSGTCGLQIQNGVANLLNNVVIRHAQTAISLNSTSSAEIRHGQIVNCPTAISAGAALTLRNVLIANATSAAISGSAAAITGEHVTIDIPTTSTRFSQNSGATLTLRNSIIYGGIDNANYSKFNTVDSWPSSPFISAGAGSHYLSPIIAGARNAGTLSGVDAMLVAELRKMTTEGPAPLTGPISTSTTLYPTAKRDTDALDLGYHYDALDYYFTSLSVSASTLTLAPGTSVAMYGNTGITFSGNGSLVSSGKADDLNHFVHYQMVQDQPTASGWPTLSTTSRIFFSAPGTSGATAQTIDLTFCDFSPGGGSSGLCAMTGTSGAFYCNTFSIFHSQLRNISFGTQYYGTMNSAGTLTLRNNCWERCVFNLYNPSTGPYTVSTSNNLFYKGTTAFYFTSYGTFWSSYNNFFDSETLVGNSGLYAGNNGFAYPLNSFGTPSVSVMSPDYRTGPLGRFYYPTTGGNLASLINQGSSTAAQAGLTHFGVTAAKDTGTVDIGFHYPTVENVWVDETLPPGAAVPVALPRDEAFNWVGSTPTAASGWLYHKGNPLPAPPNNLKQSYFVNATRQLTIRPGDTLFAYVYVESGVQSIMLQWLAENSSWDHRAYWGVNNDPAFWDPKVYMGPLPTAGAWVRLEVPAAAVALENHSVTGMGFTFDGVQSAQVSWDRAGTTAPTREVNGSIATIVFPTPVDSDNDGLPDYIEDKDGNGAVSAGETDWQRRPLVLIAPILR